MPIIRGLGHVLLQEPLLKIRFQKVNMAGFQPPHTDSSDTSWKLADAVLNRHAFSLYPNNTIMECNRRGIVKQLITLSMSYNP